MTDAPKRIWVDLKRALKTLPGNVRDKPPKQAMSECRDEYVRKDITDELAEALKVCWDELDEPTGNMGRIEAVNKARNALSKYQETPMQKLQRLGQEFDNAPEAET